MGEACLCVCVPEFDGDISFDFVFEANCVDTGDGLDDGRFAVRDMSYCPNIYRRLSRYEATAATKQIGLVVP